MESRIMLVKCGAFLFARIVTAVSGGTESRVPVIVEVNQ